MVALFVRQKTVKGLLSSLMRFLLKRAVMILSAFVLLRINVSRHKSDKCVCCSLV